MGMPWQLKVGLYNKRKYRRTEQRPIAETLPHINVNDLNIPRDYKTYTAPNISFRYPQILNMRIAYHMVEFSHSRRIQTFRFKWIKTGFGYPRPAFICECGRPVIKIYFKHQNLACRRCCNATYASRTLGKRTRPILQALRLETFLELKSYMSKRNRLRLKARIPETHNKRLDSKRLSHHRIQLPQSNYRTRGAMHWR
jgi:hypothetical protein